MNGGVVFFRWYEGPLAVATGPLYRFLEQSKGSS